MMAFVAICNDVGPPAEPFLLPLLPTLMGHFADKAPPVRKRADQAGEAFIEMLNPWTTPLVLLVLYEGFTNKRNWQVKAGSLQLLTHLARKAPQQIANQLPTIVPLVSECMYDAKQQVKTAAVDAMTACCSVVGNRDVEPFVPTLISCMAQPSQVAEGIHKLGAITFVQAVGSPCLSILVPLLVKGLREKTPVIRKTAIIIDNMVKVVYDPADAEVFLPRLLPVLDQASSGVSDPEVRAVVATAHTALDDLHAAALAGVHTKAEANMDKAAIEETLREVVEQTTGAAPAASASPVFDHIAKLLAPLAAADSFEEDTWDQCARPYLESVLPRPAAKAAAASLLAKCDHREHSDASSEDDEGIDLCNCEFSLAYGGKILLNKTTLHLKRGRRYGLCGPNGAGKSTLMRSIASGKLDGFPPKEVLKTVYVEHDIDASAAETAVVDYVMSDPMLQGMGLQRTEVEDVLESVGFGDEMRSASIASLSGGWKMKLALARAMLMKADIMLLDEPTNHLDVKNVQWLQSYLTSLPDVTSMVVSHDSGFLDAVCTDILHYEKLKLKHYKGNLSEFVKVKPEAKAYYELGSEKLKFVLPRPGFLDGVKGRDVAVLRMTNVAFTYPGTTKQVLKDVTVRCNLNSRVAVLGANGAGKSTLIKMLTGETRPNEGSVWKHPNTRVAYVAQHAFHHLEQHLDWSALEYIRWRYEIGEDREGLDKVDRAMSDTEKMHLERYFDWQGDSVRLESLHGRRKSKKTYEYEVKWYGKRENKNSWITREQLGDLGFTKLVNEVDMKEAARQGLLGLGSKPLDSDHISLHLADFGLDPEFSTHSRMRGLSGGQKVKVVLAAAMWNCPHLLVLDEPTNYLDRDSLGALADAIKVFEGGVVMISHNAEFTSELCAETWVVKDGSVTALLKGVKLEGQGEVHSAAVAAELETALKLKAQQKVEKAAKAAEKKAAKDEQRRIKYAKKGGSLIVAQSADWQNIGVSK